MGPLFLRFDPSENSRSLGVQRKDMPFLPFHSLENQPLQDTDWRGRIQKRS
jgi:hypothetical protein